MFNRFLKRISLTVIPVLMQIMVFGQDSSAVAGNSFERTMYSHDKIYVVMAVCIVILVVMILYLVRIDRKITRKGKQTEK